MFKKTLSIAITAIFVPIFFIGVVNTQTLERGGIEEIIVTAQKTDENIQDVPIAVTAFSTESLELQQIETFGDLQFNAPNITFTKSNFTGANMTIRGVNSGTVAASGRNVPRKAGKRGAHSREAGAKGGRPKKAAAADAVLQQPAAEPRADEGRSSPALFKGDKAPWLYLLGAAATGWPYGRPSGRRAADTHGCPGAEPLWCNAPRGYITRHSHPVR